MKYIICYDIKENKIRQEVVKVLETQAHRMQYSVFIGDFTEKECQALKDELLVVTQNSERRLLLIVPMCAACEAKAWTVGEPIEPLDPACIIA